MTKLASKELKIRIRLLSQISTKIRGGNLEKLFCHEVIRYPPSLYNWSEMRSGSKFKLVMNIERPTESVNDTPKAITAP